MLILSPPLRFGPHESLLPSDPATTNATFLGVVNSFVASLHVLEAIFASSRSRDDNADVLLIATVVHMDRFEMLEFRGSNGLARKVLRSQPLPLIAVG